MKKKCASRGAAYGFTTSDIDVKLVESFVFHCSVQSFSYNFESIVPDKSVEAFLSELGKKRRRYAPAMEMVIGRLDEKGKRRFLGYAAILKGRSHFLGSEAEFLCDAIEWLAWNKSKLGSLKEFIASTDVL